MKNSNDLINQVKSNLSDKPSTEPQLTTGDKDLVNWFFLRLETTYGRQFWTEFSDEKTVLLTKREWAAKILEHSGEDLHYAIEQMKSERERGNKDFEWPDIPKILGLLNNRISPDGKNSTAYLEFSDPKHPEYKPKLIESEKMVSKRKSVGNNELKNLKDMF